MRRREVVQAGLGTLLLGSGWAVRVQGASLQRDRRLVLVFLRGAVDGLSVVVPHAESAYYRARPRLALPGPNQAGGVLDLDGSFGLHPALAPLVPLWQAGSLAFVHACGSPDPGRSHFDAQDYLESGTPGIKTTPDGWLNRLLAVLPMSGSPVQAVNFGETVPRILTGRMPVASLATGRRATRRLPLDRPGVGSAFDALYSGSDALSRTYQEGRSARRELLESTGNPDETAMADNGAPASSAGFVGDASRLAGLMAHNPDVQLAFLALGGWDTHVNQARQLEKQLPPLAQGLAVLAQKLGPLYERTVILVVSEFGRTVRENGNGGTDHGHGNALWLMGGAVRGAKVYGQWPGLEESRLFEGRDLAVTTDFREVVAAVLQQHLHLERPQLAKVLPGYTPANALPGLIKV